MPLWCLQKAFNEMDPYLQLHERFQEFYRNPYLKNGFSHRYQLDGSTFIFRGVRSDF